MRQIDDFKKLFRIVFDCDENEDLTRIRRLTDQRWDSLRHVTLIAVIESEMKISLSAKELESMTSFGAVVLLLDEKGL